MQTFQALELKVKEVVGLDTRQREGNALISSEFGGVSLETFVELFKRVQRTTYVLLPSLLYSSIQSDFVRL